MCRTLSVCGTMVIGSVVLILGGCSSNYYAVKDPVSGNSYYTEDIDEISGGAIQFTDQRTGSMVTIQNSVVKEINEQEYNTGKNSAK